jgi:hypothetical protein
VQGAQREVDCATRDGVKPLANGIDFAKKTVEIAILRFDRKEVEHAVENA